MESDGKNATKEYKIVKCCKEDFPKTRFVGIRYKDSDRVNGMFGYYWGQWFEEGRFDILEKLLTDEFMNVYPDADAYIGLMKYRNGADKDYFEYWIGMFLPNNCEVPEGFEYIDLDYDAVGICWVQGKEENVYCVESECYDRMKEKNMKMKFAKDGGYYFFERYGCPRFTTPDENGEVILDIGYFVEK